MLYNMSFPSVPAGGLAPPPAKHWGYKPNTLSTSFPIPPGPSVAPPRPKNLPPGMPFDPAELARKLAMVERKQLAKERARAVQGSRYVSRLTEVSPIVRPTNGTITAQNKPSEQQQTSPVPYRHGPNNAATQFTLNTTNDSIRDAELAHRLSQCDSIPLALDEKVSTMERRAQIHTSSIPENVTPSIATLDNQVKPRSRPQTVEGNALMSTFEAQAVMGNGHARHHSASAAASSGMSNYKRTSKGSFDTDGKTRHSWLLLSPPPIESEASEPEPEPVTNFPGRELDQATINEHRIDWTQRDEEIMSLSHGVSSKRNLKLKKADSIWTLRGRLSSLGRHHKDGPSSSPKKIKSSMDLSTSPPTKSPKNGFFARFKRL